MSETSVVILNYFPYIGVVLEAFRQLEKQHHIKILFAIEVSSQVYGWASETSDYDLKFVYVKALDYYVSIDEKKPITIDFELAPTDTRPQISLSGWELGKALKQVRSSNSGFLEWLFSPTVYYDRNETIEKLRELACEAFSLKSFVFSYIAIAAKHHKLYFETRTTPFKGLKKYFYVARPLLAVRLIMERHRRQNKQDIYSIFPPLSIQTLLHSLAHVSDIPHTALADLLALKKQNSPQMNSTQTEKIPQLEMWFVSAFQNANTFAESLPILREAAAEPFNIAYVNLFTLNWGNA